jgi:hypothetical protein
MQFPDNKVTRDTERVMAALRRADVLKGDLPNFPTHYNRAFSAVREALNQGELDLSETVGASSPIPLSDRPKYPPAQHGNIFHSYILSCSICVAAGVKPVYFSVSTNRPE